MVARDPKIKQYILKQIDEGGIMLQSEKEFTKKFQVSRMTCPSKNQKIKQVPNNRIIDIEENLI